MSLKAEVLKVMSLQKWFQVLGSKPWLAAGAIQGVSMLQGSCCHQPQATALVKLPASQCRGPPGEAPNRCSSVGHACC